MRLGVGELLLILAIVVLLFGTRKLKTLGTDLGSAIRGFRGALREGEEDAVKSAGGRVIDADATKQSDKSST